MACQGSDYKEEAFLLTMLLVDPTPAFTVKIFYTIFD